MVQTVAPFRFLLLFIPVLVALIAHRPERVEFFAGDIGKGDGETGIKGEFEIPDAPQKRPRRAFGQRRIKPCKLCNNFSTDEICSICSSPKREKDIICIVEEPKDILAIEKTSQYNGVYYVLLGALSPLEGINGEDLNIRKLINRIECGEIKEVIISTDPDNDGELTAQFLIQQLSTYKVKIYRIAIGIPLGTQIEYIDSATLGKALLDRKSVSQ